MRPVRTVSSGRFTATQAVYNREHITASVTFSTALVFLAMHYLVTRLTVSAK